MRKLFCCFALGPLMCALVWGQSAPGVTSSGGAQALVGKHLWLCPAGQFLDEKGRPEPEMIVTSASIAASPEKQPGIAILSLGLRGAFWGRPVQVKTEISDLSVTEGQLLWSLTAENLLRDEPVPDLAVGVPKWVVYCRLGKPDHTNIDLIGNDQMVYQSQDTYVYVDHRTGLVQDVQTTE